MNKRDLRIRKIIDALQEQPELSIPEIADLFHVSHMTIRRDLHEIERRHLLSGGQISEQIPMPLQIQGTGSHTNAPSVYDYYYEETQNVTEKQRIAACAAGLIGPDEVIILDSGTTTGVLSTMLPADIPLTVITYSPYIFNNLIRHNNIRLYLAGGLYHPNTQVLESEEGISFLSGLRANKVFMCASGVLETLEVTCSDQYIVALKKAALAVSIQKYLLVDSSKFDKTCPGFVASLSAFHTIVTDTGLSPAWQRLIRENGIELQLV